MPNAPDLNRSRYTRRLLYRKGRPARGQGGVAMDTALDCCNESVNGGRHFYECGCTLYLGNMLLVSCPLHAAAEEMRALVTSLEANLETVLTWARPDMPPLTAVAAADIAAKARALLARVGGRTVMEEEMCARCGEEAVGDEGDLCPECGQVAADEWYEARAKGEQ